ncbi:hypothetical protein DPMN_078979 [Dreissena polymorpha]|uniref:Uncharacterized protein n=1 Tax=Dreissena polymorpha TaxID=45954 RepID=A0A9D3YN87_DREPO|nr:hypothetical protein DPMN_078979 [Dreissena polymorpha]
MTFRSLGGHHIHYTTETSKSKAAKSSVVIHVFQVIDLETSSFTSGYRRPAFNLVKGFTLERSAFHARLS